MEAIQHITPTAPGAGRCLPCPHRPGSPAASGEATLCHAVCKGLKEAAAAQAKALAEEGRDILDIINGELVPALDQVGQGFEKGTLFLPQLLMSAEAAKGAFQVLQGYLPAGGEPGEPQILLATVQGDIHDIGKKYREGPPGELPLSGCWTWARMCPRRPSWPPPKPGRSLWWACPP